MLAMAVTLSAADLEAVKAEPKLERRSDKALANAHRALDEARKAYEAGDIKKTEAALDEAGASVELSYQSLSETGKHPRSSPKYFKRAELGVRELLRRLKSIESEFAVDDRPMIHNLQQRLQRVREDLLNGIMSKKK